MINTIIKLPYIKEFKNLKYWNVSYFAPRILKKGSFDDWVNLQNNKGKEIDLNNNFYFERPYNEGIEWKLKKEMEVLELFKEYRIIPKSCDKEPISDDDWIDAFANIRILNSIVNKNDSAVLIFCIRLNTMILKKELKNNEEAEKTRKRLVRDLNGF